MGPPLLDTGTTYYHFGGFIGAWSPASPERHESADSLRWNALKVHFHVLRERNP